MKYRRLGAGGPDISILSAGLFQLDFAAGALGRAGFEKQLEAVRYAVSMGVNAINLGFPFYIDGCEEYAQKVKAFLREEGISGKARLFVNLPVTGSPSLDDFERRLAWMQEWFGIGCFDYCLIEDIERFGWARFERIGALDWAVRQAEEGRIGKLGFDFRDDCFFLKNIFDAYSWDVAQFRYSYMDSVLHPGFSGIRYVTDAGAGLVVTEPFKGRRLIDGIPAEVQALWDGAREKREVDEWALLWAWNHPEISSVFTSFKDVEEAERLIGYAQRQAPIDMFAEITINKAADAYRKKRAFGCTECRCCMPCPAGMDSPGIAALYNDYLMYGNEDVPRFLYRIRGFDAIECTGCGVCTKNCPRRYQLMDAVRQAQALFGKI